MLQMFLKLYEKLNKVKPDAKAQELIQEAINSNNLDSPENIPQWFLDFWRKVIGEQTMEKQYFMASDILNTDVDLINFLAELADVIDMNYDNYGEGITITFKPLHLNAFICMEGGPGVCFYEIKSIDNK